MRPSFEVNAEVAVVPLNPEFPGEVAGIVRIRHVGHTLVQTNDCRMYSRIDGIDLCGKCRIERATNQHRIAFMNCLPASRRVRGSLA